MFLLHAILHLQKIHPENWIFISWKRIIVHKELKEFVVTDLPEEIESDIMNILFPQYGLLLCIVFTLSICRGYRESQFSRFLKSVKVGILATGGGDTIICSKFLVAVRCLISNGYPANDRYWPYILCITDILEEGRSKGLELGSVKGRDLGRDDEIPTKVNKWTHFDY